MNQSIKDAFARFKEHVDAAIPKEKIKKYEKIATITVTPDTEGKLPQAVIFSADSDGNTFELTDFIIKATAAFVSGSTSTLYMEVNDVGVIGNGSISSLGTDLRTFNIFFRAENDGCKRVEFTSSLSSSSYFNPQAAIDCSRLVPPMAGHNLEKINKVRLYTLLPTDGDKAWIEGSTFELWGVRA